MARWLPAATGEWREGWRIVLGCALASATGVALLFFAAGGWGFVFWGVCARVTAGVFGHWLVGYFAHNHGRIHHEVMGATVQGHNLPMLSLLTMGECWHNNHHAFPESARIGLEPGQTDPGWWVIRGLERLGWVYAVSLPREAAERDDLLERNSA